MTSRPRSTRHGPGSLGVLLRTWRRTRGVSQLALATRLGVSARHLSFVETGRSSPSREMVLRLADGLDVPLRDQNALLMAAGYAPLYREADLDDPELGPIHRALTAILNRQDPHPAVVMDRGWSLVRANRGARVFFAHLLGGRRQPGRPNILRSMFDPQLLRPYVVDWERVAGALMQRVHREAVGGVPDQDLLEELLAYPGVPDDWRVPDLATSSLPVIPVTFQKEGRRFSYFSTVTTLGTPQDITLQELRIECFFPMDEQTERWAAELAAG
jgi:transcriptional regulator with XRE-family HTH domain